jgi:DNA polymerase III subunit alpha
MSPNQFIHLRARTAYSLLEGAIKVEKLVDHAFKTNMPAVAVTDTANLFGALEFSLAAASKGIQPIIGCTLRIRLNDDDKDVLTPFGELATLAVLVQNEVGYLNLTRLVSQTYLSPSGSYKPHVMLSDLLESSEGLIILSGGEGGLLNLLFASNQDKQADDLCLQFKEKWENRFYIELNRYGLSDESFLEEKLIGLAYKHNFPLVATNHAYFLNKDLYSAHDVLMAIADGTTVFNETRRKLTPHHCLKSSEEMIELFSDIPEAIQNTVIIAKRCAYMPETRAPIFPTFQTREGFNDQDELRAQALEGLENRLLKLLWLKGEKGSPEREAHIREYKNRLNYELDIIIQMGFSGYFLIVADFIKWAKNNDIPVGPGRGSGAGSVVAWSLTITDLDPIKFGLLFERFLNPERVSLPDFDIDFCQERRDEVIRYVQQKYGHDRVAHIITFGKLQARAVLRDVGRALGMPYGQVDRICKLIPSNPAAPVTIEEAIDADPQIQALATEDEMVARLLEIGQKLEGLYRHASTHAAGVVIGDRPLCELVPLYQDQRSHLPATQFNMKYVEQAGLIKFDFLGLKTLTVIHEAVKMLKSKGIELDIVTLPLDDKLTFELFQRADTVGVFQVEGAGMRDVLRKMKPTKFEDLIALVALYRPGPMENIPKYIAYKHGLEDIVYLHPKLETILSETYGIMIYQEQVMEAAQKLAGYSLGNADLLRRAMGKKVKTEMDAQQKIFVDGAISQGIDEKIAIEIFEQMAKFAGYGFNKSHAAAYALVMYQTAYLKANYVLEFMAATMTYDIDNTDKINIFREDLKQLNIEFLPPCMNHSSLYFSVEKSSHKAIRYALAGIKGVGVGAVESFIEERQKNGPYKDLNHFLNRIDIKSFNKRQFENLTAAGAFDCFGYAREVVYENIDYLMTEGNTRLQSRKSNQSSFFASDDEEAPLNLRNIVPWSAFTRLQKEFDAIGFYLSSHPLDAYQFILKALQVVDSQNLEHVKGKSRIVMAGIVVDYKVRTSAKGNKFAFVHFTDAAGSFESVIFSELLLKKRELLDSKTPLLLTLDLRRNENDQINLALNNIESLQDQAQKMALKLSLRASHSEDLHIIKKNIDLLEEGNSSICLLLETPQHSIKMHLPKKYKINNDFLQNTSHYLVRG